MNLAIALQISPDAITKDWWPLCARCGQPVEDLRIVPLRENATKYDRAIRHYVVSCHGQSEEAIVGIWAAYSIAANNRRLPDAFKVVMGTSELLT